MPSVFYTGPFGHYHFSIVLTRFTISMAVVMASKPLFPALVPALSTACSMESVVSTPKITGTPVSSPARAMPFVASLATMSKCGVAPLITAPRHTIASYFPDCAIFLAMSGISKAPGTHATSMSSALPPWRRKESSAPERSLDVMNSLKRAATMPILWPAEILRPCIRVGAFHRCHRTLRSRYAGPRRYVVYGDSECRAMIVRVLVHHLHQSEFRCQPMTHGHAYQPFAEGRHEIHIVPAGISCGTYQVSWDFVFPS